MMRKTPLNILLAAVAILGMSAATSWAATTDDQVAQAPAPAAQSSPAAETPVTDQAKPADDKASTKPATEKTAVPVEKSAPEKSVRTTERKARVERPTAPVRTARVVRRDYYRIAQSADIERVSRGCFGWCGRMLFIGVGY
jgi:hypothetical protein